MDDGEEQGACDGERKSMMSGICVRVAMDVAMAVQDAACTCVW